MAKTSKPTYKLRKGVKMHTLQSRRLAAKVKLA